MRLIFQHNLKHTDNEKHKSTNSVAAVVCSVVLRKKFMTEEQRKARNEQKKHQRINEKYCHTILMKDWKTFEELMPYKGMIQDDNGGNVLVVCNAQGTKFVKHTIRTESITEEEAKLIQ